MLLRLAYLGVTNTLAMLRLLPMRDRAKDAEILAPRHQIKLIQRQLHGGKVRFNPADRALLAAPLHPLPHAPYQIGAGAPWSRPARLMPIA